MPLTINDIQKLAADSWRDGRKIVVDGAGDKATARFGSFLIDPSRAENIATMKAFKDLLQREYGVFGLHTFDSLLGTRQQLGKGLRVADVKAVMSSLAAVRKVRYLGELGRQYRTSPKYLRLGDADRKLVEETLKKDCFKGVDTAQFRTQDDVVEAARKRVDAAIADVLAKKGGEFGRQTFEPRGKVETAVRENEAMGLRNLNLEVGRQATSVEDRVKKGELGRGMVLNLGAGSNVMLFEGLKSAGVEPGFNFRYDWSPDDTLGMMADIHSEVSVLDLEELLDNDPALAEKCRGKTLREKIMLAGRAHGAGMAAVAEFAICEAARLVRSGENLETSRHPFAKLAKALQNYVLDKAESEADDDFRVEGDDPIARLAYLADHGDERDTTGLLNEVKTELFTQIRDAVTNVPADHEYSARSPIFEHFSSTHILKLDYNERDRAIEWESAHAGSFQRPERYLANHGAFMRFATSASADDISAGAVTEALANDLSRLAGVPTQELRIVRGSYSDGHPKLMIESKYSTGYSDMKDSFFKDGRVTGQNVESLGKYKAFFLLLGDRDAIGKRGQNKGFVVGRGGGEARFFAIDPGHSLEGNSLDLQVNDDLSFKDTAFVRHFDKRFANFSVFDDDTRFAKIKGLADLRATWESGAFKRLFADYRSKFNPAEPDISAAEKKLRQKITEKLDSKEAELEASYKRLIGACKAPLALYEALKGDAGLQEGAINAVSHLEMLTSPTTWTSKKGQVELKHLEIARATRVRWTGAVAGGNIVFTCDKPLDRAQRDRLDAVAKMTAGVVFDPAGRTLTVPKDKAGEFFAQFNEDYVQKTTHPQEYAKRHPAPAAPVGEDWEIL